MFSIEASPSRTQISVSALHSDLLKGHYSRPAAEETSASDEDRLGSQFRTKK
jgi:hypothetical protein